MKIIGTVLFQVFMFLSWIHFYWALGGTWASRVVFPTKDDTIPAKFPGKLPTILVAVVLMFLAAFYLITSGVIKVNLPTCISTYGLLSIVIIFLLRAIGDFNYVGVFKKIKDTKFGKNDTKIYSPLSLAICILTIILMLKIKLLMPMIK